MDTSHREPRPSDPSNLSHRFTFRYTIALVVLGLMIGSVFLSTIYITRKDNLSPAAINIAGRQRMLSQKIAMLSLELLHAEYDQEELRTRLSNAIALMERSNHGLVHGDQEVRLESLPEHSSLWYLYMAPPHALDARTRHFLEHARGWADTPPEERTASDKRLLYILKEANGELVVLLDRAVTLFQVESEQHLHAVQLTYLVLFVLALGGLLGVAILVFRPMGKLIARETLRMTKLQKEQLAKAKEQDWSNRLQDALDMVDGELELLRVVERAMELAIPEQPIELLLADASDAHIHRAAVHPTHGGPGCSVESPWGCTAVRRGHPMVFESNTDLNACPRLVERGEACSAVCIPVSFMGRSLGVYHATGPDLGTLDPESMKRMASLASLSGNRIGTVRTFERVQLQASTDPLTGLINRRTLQERLRALNDEGQPFALAMVDLDRFKKLNDTYGHDVGDQALVVFTKAAREALGEQGFIARFGGEEFVVVMPGCDLYEGNTLLEGIRRRLEQNLRDSSCPKFTASFGLADTTMTREIASLIHSADQALLAAKNAGRDRVMVSSPQGVCTLEEMVQRRGTALGMGAVRDVTGVEHEPQPFAC